MNESNQLAVAQQSQTNALTYTSSSAFDHIQRVAKCFSESALVPQVFQKNIPNTVIALEMANRIGASPLAVMQNLYIVHGKPSWASQFIIACLNTCGRFEPLMFETVGTGDDRTCVAWTTPRGTKLPARDDKRQWTIALAKEAGLVVLDGAPCSIGIAKKEGWFTKNGSKWQTMPELMLRYRAATFFGRIYAPELLMGMKSYEEVLDVGTVIEVKPPEPEVRFTKPVTQEAPPAESVETGSGSATEVATAPQTQPAEEKPADKTPEPQPEQETPQHVKVENFYRSEGKAEFADVMKTLKRLQPSLADKLNVEGYSKLDESIIAKLWSGRHGTVREVKKDLNAK